MAYEDYRWGDPPPTEKQYEFARHLGIPLRNGLTKWELSDLITVAVAIRDGAGVESRNQRRRGCLLGLMVSFVGRCLAVVAALMATFVTVALFADKDKTAGVACPFAFCGLAIVCLWFGFRRTKSGK